MTQQKQTNREAVENNITIVILNLSNEVCDEKKDSSQMKSAREKEEKKEKEEYGSVSTSYQSILFALLPMPTRWQDVIIGECIQ